MLFLPYTRQCWLLSEVRPHDHDLAYGLHDDGRGTGVKASSVSLSLPHSRASSIAQLSVTMSFQAEATMASYVDHSIISGNIVTPTAYFCR